MLYYNTMNTSKVVSAVVGLAILGLAVWAASMRGGMDGGRPPGGSMMINPSSTQTTGSNSTGVPPTDADGDGDDAPVTVPNRY